MRNSRAMFLWKQFREPEPQRFLEQSPGPSPGRDSLSPRQCRERNLERSAPDPPKPAWQSAPLLVSSPRLMASLRIISALVLCLIAIAVSREAQQQPGWQIEARRDSGVAEYDLGGPHMLRGTGGVLVKYGGAVLIAETVTLDQQSGEALAEGKVRIQR